jgi:DNA-directed RNA polymerase beta subunit
MKLSSPSPLPAHLRDFDDTDKTRELIYSGALDAVSKRFPVEDDEYRIELHKPRYTGVHTYTLEQQKQALMKERRLTTPITGTWKLVHKPTGAVLDEREDVVMHIPYYTQRGTFIHGGNEYSIVNQARLRPGVYIRRQRTGEIEGHVNVKSGTGKPFRVQLEPNTGVFKLHVGQSNVPLYPLLRAVGVTDQQLIKAWGADLVTANIKKQDTRSIAKLYERFAGYRAEPGIDEAGQTKYLRDSLPLFELDEDVNARTLGLTGAKGVTPDVLLRMTSKMLGVSRGEEDPDDRDSPQFSHIYGVEDLIRERIDKDAGKLTQSMLRKVRRSRDLQSVHRGALNAYLDSLLLGSGLAMPLEETNPLHTLEQLNRITKLGEGGIGSAEAITDEARDVNSGQFGFVDPITGPEGMNIGIDVRAAYRTFKGNDNNMYAEFNDVGTGKPVYLRPDEAAARVIAFPGQDPKAATIYAMRRGKVERVPRSEVDLVVPSFAHMMSSHTNLNPMPTAVQAGRQFYGAKFWSQYMPQVAGEVPLVDSLMPDGKTTWTEHYGRKVGTLRSEVGGVVTKVTDKGVTVTDANGKKHVSELVTDFPFNRLTGISYYPAVKVGDQVNVGDMVAHSNFTDSKTGALNLGRNLRTAIIPYRGHSYEDAYVISKTAADKLATERLQGFDLYARHGVEMGRSKYISAFPRTYNTEQIANLDADGVVKPGTVLNKGDPIALAVGPRLLTSADAQLGKLHKVLRNAYTDKSLTWDYSSPGTVTDVALTRNGVRVNIKSTPPVSQGDKLSTRFGLKGVVGTILDDDKMPRDPVTNQPYELLLNPMAVLSRVAPNQIMEMALGKIAAKTGKQVRIPQEPPPEGWMNWVQAQLDAAGITDSADIFDPESGKTIRNIGDGSVYVSAFHHLAEKKLSSRGDIGSYTADEQPARGGGTGAKKFSQMDVNAALAHGATDVIKDVITIRGTKNEEFWKALKLGRPLPEPKVPFIYDKFLNTLRAGGINVVEKGDITQLLPMLDDDVKQLSKGVVTSSDMVDANFEPMAGGLFDAGRTGGMSGNRWTHIELPEPLPNPVMEEPIRRLLGLKIQDMEDIVAGRQLLDGKTGGGALKAALEKVDLDAMIAEHRQKVRVLRGANRDNSVKVLGYLASAKEQGIHPSKWVISKVPVLPPVFRPISRMGDVALSADLNELYRDVLESSKTFNELKPDLPDSELADERLNIYNSVRAAYGFGDSITPEGRSKRLKGAVRQVIGTSPKFGLFQSKVISKPVDVVGRGVVIPNPNLDMDQLGIPEDSAWTLYKDFVMRALVRHGYPAIRAAEMLENRTPEAREFLDKEMAARPVIMDRAPTWHKFNLLAFYPHIVEGHTLQVSPLVTKGFNMDFDGDQANFHVPVSDKAVSQATRKMLPSTNLFSLTDLQSVRHAPSMEMTYGLYQLTRAQSKKPTRVFKTAKEAKAAYKAGEIAANDPIEILA